MLRELQTVQAEGGGRALAARRSTGTGRRNLPEEDHRGGRRVGEGAELVHRVGAPGPVSRRGFLG